MSGRLTGDARARLVLSLLAEPGDPRLRLQLADREPAALVAALGVEPSVEDRVTLAIGRAEAAGLRWITPGHPHWPEQLADLDHVENLQDTVGAPWGLWVRGAERLAGLAARSVAVVGARSCSTYGAEAASDVAADLASTGFTVVSGAAYGIDASAHRGALAVAGPTIAVLACGADTAYPVAHTQLLDRIVDEGGLVVSEQAPGATPLKHRFLSRNRIIAALAQGTVVIEAARRSGSLNTLHWADLLGRTTMALPGPVTSSRSAGTHDAVRSGKAVLVTSADEVVQELLGMAA